MAEFMLPLLVYDETMNLYKFITLRAPAEASSEAWSLSALDTLGTILGCLRSIVGSGAVLEFVSVKGKFWMILDDLLALCPEHALARIGWRSANACGDRRQPLP